MEVVHAFMVKPLKPYFLCECQPLLDMWFRLKTIINTRPRSKFLRAMYGNFSLKLGTSFDVNGDK